MYRRLHSSRQPAAAPHRATCASEAQPASEFPQPGEVLGEIGLLLAVHLAVALAVALVLPPYGIP
jgi:hypothetical protein